MCGIAGYFSTHRPIEAERFDVMVDSLSHRGPDGRGIYFARNKRVAVGHRRLAILDLSTAGAQPMVDPSGRYILSFNGEIYNHLRLRPALEKQGAEFQSSCDAETLLAAYVHWGPDCLNRIEGMFAFLVYDTHMNRVFAARDPFGIKPLYWWQRGDQLIIASQPRTILSFEDGLNEVDTLAFVDALRYGIVPAERAAFNGMHKLAPAHSLAWEHGRVETKRYWALKAERCIHDMPEAAKEVATAISGAVCDQLLSDVPVATFLSGGIDSSIITAAASKQSGKVIDALTVGFEERASDERAFAKIMADHVKARLHTHVLSKDEAWTLMDQAAETFDEPFGMGAALPMLGVAQLAHEEGFKVVLSGDGADELFDGYTHYDALERRYKKRGRTADGTLVNPILAGLTRLVLGPFKPLDYYEPHEAMMGPTALRALLPTPLLSEAEAHGNWRQRAFFPNGKGGAEAGRIFDLSTYLPDEILTKVDRATMAFSIEARVPFLSREVANVAFSIAPLLHRAGGVRKAALKAATRGWLPDALVTNRKKGFSIPIEKWIVGPGERTSHCQRIIKGPLPDLGLIDGGKLKLFLADAAPNQIFHLTMLNQWAARWAA